MSFLIRSKIMLLFLQLMTFLIFYFISMVILDRSYYLFRWTADNLYLYIWIPIIILTLKDKGDIALVITIANMFGIIVGQFLGDYIAYVNQERITAETPPEIVWALVETHLGFQIWILVLVFSLIITLLLKKLLYDGKISHKSLPFCLVTAIILSIIIILLIFWSQSLIGFQEV